MKTKQYIFGIILIINFHFLIPNVQAQDVFDIDKVAFSEAARHYKFQSSTYKGVAQAANYDLKYHRFNWEINPSIKYIKGDVTTFFVPIISNFNEIYFDLSSALTVDSVKYHDTIISFNHFSDNSLRLDLPSIIPQNTLDSVTIFYQGVPPLTGNEAFTQSTHASQPVIYTLSEPFGAHEWWPCKESLTDKIDSIDIFVTTPKQYKVGTQGLLVNTTTNGADNTYYWKHRYPIVTYLISLAVTNYAEFTINANLTQGTLPIQNFVYPEDSTTYYNQINFIKPIIQLYDSLFTPYPFMNEKYGHAQFGWNGGMEHQTMSSMGNFSEHLMSHELAHQWFGDKITCDSWTEIWLNEGFATYCTGLFYKHLAPVWWMPWREDMINSATSQPGGSVYCTDTTSISRIFSSRLSYKKGAYLLRMLDWKMGEINFFQAINNYLADANLAYNFASTQSLKNQLELVSGLNLTEFFNDWYYGEGFPSYQVTCSQIGTNLNFVVNQTQSHASVSFYEMPIPIYVKGQGFDTTFVFDHTFSGENFSATVPFIIDSVFFDPELWILSKNNTVDFTVGIDKTIRLNDVKVFPNPAEHLVNISANQPIKGIKIYDVLGKQIQTINYTLNTYKGVIDISNLKNGIYTIEIEFKNGNIRKKINKI
ncbi:MAG: T9SS type A sorting domain-containing protein [Bacteroidetes bacterium]|nr:T9SS type A sorting domain-containing protein [Bacteroidota bacterium]